MAEITPQDAEALNQAVANAEEAFAQAGEEFNEDDIELALQNPPQRPSFPIIIFLIAAANDAMDIIGTLVGVGPIVTIPFQVIFSIILGFWFWGSGKWWKKYIVRWMWVRFVATVGIELIPYVGEIVPMNMIFVLMVHYKETKLVKLYEKLLEELREAGVTG